VDDPVTNNTVKDVAHLNEQVAQRGQWPGKVKATQKASTGVDALALPKQRSTAAGKIMHLLLETAGVFHRRLAAGEHHPETTGDTAQYRRVWPGAVCLFNVHSATSGSIRFAHRWQLVPLCLRKQQNVAQKWSGFGRKTIFLAGAGICVGLENPPIMFKFAAGFAAHKVEQFKRGVDMTPIVRHIASLIKGARGFDHIAWSDGVSKPSNQGLVCDGETDTFGIAKPRCFSFGCSRGRDINQKPRLWFRQKQGMGNFTFNVKIKEVWLHLNPWCSSNVTRDVLCKPGVTRWHFGVWGWEFSRS
jgi:hypothetical protein